MCSITRCATGWLVCLLVLCGSPPFAMVIGFDYLLGGGVEFASIDSPYSGLAWSNFSALDTVLYAADMGTNGYANGVVSLNNVGFAGYGMPAGFSAAQPFTLDSYSIGAAWNNNMSITVQGWRSGMLLDTDTFLISATGSETRQSGWSGIDTVLFAASGGTDAGYRGWGPQYYLDDIHLSELPIPEPPGAAWLLGAVAVALLFANQRRCVRPADNAAAGAASAP